MKSKKFWKILLALVCFGMGGIAANYSVLTVEAKTSMTTFPKKMQGTWYQFDKSSNRIEKQKITAKKWIFYNHGKKETGYLHAEPVSGPAYPKPEKKKENWIYISGGPIKARGRMWIGVVGWYQISGMASYNVSKLKGHWVLTNAGGSGLWGSNHWYRSAKLAKKLKNKRYAHFVY